MTATAVRAGRTPAAVAAGILPLLAVAELMLVLDVSIVNVALPTIRADLGFGPSGLAWVVNAYALAFGGFLLLGGRAADLVGGRRVFLGALTAFVAMSLACGLASGRLLLVVARAGQGLSAAVLSPATLSILTATYRGEARHRALAIWTAVAIAGGAVGGLLGGVLTGLLSWRWIFIVNVPVGAVLLVLAAGRLPRGRPAARGPLDLAGAVSATGGLVALVWALIRSHDVGWGSAQVLGGLFAAAVLLAAFALVEARLARAPLVPFGVFRSRALSAGNVLSFLSFVPVLPTWFLLTLYLQGVRGCTPLQTGLLFVPMSLAVIGGSQLGFAVLPRASARALLAAGGLVACAGLAWLGALSDGTSLVWVIVAGSIAMVGGGVMFAPITVAATTVAGPEHGGLASGLLNTTRQLGGAVGLAVLGTLASSAGRGTALTAGAAVFLATAAVGALALPARLESPRGEPAPG
jgi:EmrB/QacA subfamily drug resistance transporter